MLDEMKAKVDELVQGAVLGCKAPADDVRRDATGQSLLSWRRKHTALAVAAAGGNLVGGPVALAALAIELPALLNIMSRAALGIGVITVGDCSDDDYEAILAHWAGELALDGDLKQAAQSHFASGAAAAALSNTGVSVATKLGGAAGAAVVLKTGAKLNAMMLTSAVGAVISRKVAIKASTKIAAGQLAAQIIGRLPARFIPILGAGVAGGLNAWFLNSLMDAAERYYGFMGEAAEGAVASA